jgi:LPXTG-motif cell wall-anchored protein
MKHSNSIIKVAACSALFVAALIPATVRADDWNKQTLMTFSEAVQVPGATLPAGTYVFKLAENNANRCIVQIFNERQDHIYATVLAIPDIHLNLKPAEKTEVSFYEAPVGQPLPVKAWFYPGDNMGREFVYSNREAVLIAAAGKETVPSEEKYGTVASAQTQAPAVAEQPAPQEAAPAPAVTQEQTTTAAVEPAPAPQSNEVAAIPVTPEPAPEQTPEPATTLPSTGSEWPLAGLIGLGSLAGALALRTARRAS